MIFHYAVHSFLSHLLAVRKLSGQHNKRKNKYSLPAKDTCQNEPANIFPIYGGPQGKKRKRTETDEILAAATSALKSLGSRQGQQSSLYSSIGQVVSLNAQEQRQCMSDIFSLLSKYTAPTTGRSEA
ncbi:hypothetical protein AVEN_178032-1 [Araneus ventricosus]|uniref:Uncharacterized protein n=1 Tax=Araneus ventricosus TaxID=182803 RepID=A0A4Y2I480_ARAVE|nr:hypothetical protein AVEN_178032-1 [Araneus ventricosus]